MGQGLQGHDPREALLDVDAAAHAVPTLVDPEHKGVAEVSDLLELNVKVTKALAVRLDVSAEVLSAVECAQLIPEVECRIEQGFESSAELTRVGLFHNSEGFFDVLLRHRPLSIAGLAPAAQSR